MNDISPAEKHDWVEPIIELLSASESKGQLEFGTDASVFGNEHFS